MPGIGIRILSDSDCVNHYETGMICADRRLVANSTALEARLAKIPA